MTKLLQETGSGILQESSGYILIEGGSVIVPIMKGLVSKVKLDYPSLKALSSASQVTSGKLYDYHTLYDKHQLYYKGKGQDIKPSVKNINSSKPSIKRIQIP